jgi:hypothetical protein
MQRSWSRERKEDFLMSKQQERENAEWSSIEKGGKFVDKNIIPRLLNFKH